MYVCMFINVLVGSDNFMQHMLSITDKGNNVCFSYCKVWICVHWTVCTLA